MGWDAGARSQEEGGAGSGTRELGLQDEGGSTGARARSVVRPWSPRICPSGPSSTARRAGSGALRNPRSVVSGVRYRVSRVSSRGRVSCGRKTGGL